MFLNSETYSIYTVTYIDNFGDEQEARIMCKQFQAEERFKEEYKGKYTKIIKCVFNEFLIQ